MQSVPSGHTNVMSTGSMWKDEPREIADVYIITTPLRQLLGVSPRHFHRIAWRNAAVTPLFTWHSPADSLGFKNSYELYVFDISDRAGLEALIAPASPRYFKVYTPRFEEPHWRKENNVIDLSY